MDRRDCPPELSHLPWSDRWQLPVPHIVERPGGVPNLGILDPRRAAECYRERLCAMCGLRMGDEVALYGDEVSLEPDDGFWIEAPVHERCLELALGGVCPFISRENYRRRRVDDPDVVVLGERDYLPQVGREIAKRPAVMAIARHYEMAMMVTGPGQHMPVYLTPRGVLRVRRFGWVDGRAAEMPPAAPQSPAEPPEQRRVRVVRVQRTTPKRRHR